MMKGLELIHLCRKVSAIPLVRGIRTDAVLCSRRGVPRRIPDEPGTRHRRAYLQDKEVIEEMEDENDLEGEVDMMNIDRAYDLNESEKGRIKQRLGHMITAKKFFSPRPQPRMLTCNEMQCIMHLHKQDPVQWSVHTLSESFPATPDTIKKIIKGKWKCTPERAKILDSKAQRNWELLAEGKLDADPDVLEHFKKFINRQEVLLEQIENADFYLPEVKKEPVWNKGEFTGLLGKYERAIQKFVKESKREEELKMLKDGTEKNGGEETTSSLDIVRTKVDREVSRRSLENKDSFLYGDVTKFLSKNTTLENLEEKILKRADANRKLDVMEKAILETKLGVKSEQSSRKSQATETPPPETGQENMKESLETGSRRFEESGGRKDQFISRRRVNFREVRSREDETEINSEYVPPDERTLSGSEGDIGKLLENILNQPQPKEETTEKVEEKPKIDLSDSERVRRENAYYDKEVKDIEKTAFWNSGRSSKEKALAEQSKRPHDGPYGVETGSNPASTFTLSQEAYPQRIKIPKDKKRPGLTYKVKDCYYDDDGEFLYRVPGMTK